MKSGHVTRAMVADLESALNFSSSQDARVVDQASKRDVTATAIRFAKLLNEARILLQRFDADPSFGSDIGDFERRCRELVGPIIETKR